MTKKRTPEQEAILKDILAEKTIWQLYRTSRRIPFSSKNTVLGIAIGLIAGVCSLWSTSAGALADQLQTLSAVVFTNALTVLGFLLAGFAFFATLADRAMLGRMAELQHTGSGLSFLKYNLLTFLRVFCEFLVMALVSLLLLLWSTKGIGLRELAARAADTIGTPPGPFGSPRQFFVSAFFSLFVGALVYLILQLGSFIFNIFHVAMTIVRWTLEIEYDQQPEVHVAEAAVPPVKPSESAPVGKIIEVRSNG